MHSLKVDLHQQKELLENYSHDSRTLEQITQRFEHISLSHSLMKVVIKHLLTLIIRNFLKLRACR